jgi:hypothetical protein
MFLVVGWGAGDDVVSLVPIACRNQVMTASGRALTPKAISQTIDATGRSKLAEISVD